MGLKTNPQDPEPGLNISDESKSAVNTLSDLQSVTPKPSSLTVKKQIKLKEEKILTIQNEIEILETSLSQAYLDINIYKELYQSKKDRISALREEIAFLSASRRHLIVASILTFFGALSFAYVSYLARYDNVFTKSFPSTYLFSVPISMFFVGMYLFVRKPDEPLSIFPLPGK